MEISTNERGSAAAVMLGVGAVIIIVGTVVLFMTPAAEESADVTGDAAGTRLAGDPALDGLSAEDLAADGPADVPTELIEKDGDAMMEEEMVVPPVEVPELTEPNASGTYEPYSADKLARAETGDVVLFFHAAWCPTCRGLENNIQANASSIPYGVHILKVDYDSATALKQKYGVTRQHTLVQVDASGNEIKTLTGLTNTLDQVVSQIN